MRAYYVSNNAYDTIVIPATHTAYNVGPNTMQDYLAPDPDWGNWSDQDMGDLKPVDYGDVLAYRDGGDEVVVLEHFKWAGRLAFWGVSIPA